MTRHGRYRRRRSRRKARKAAEQRGQGHRTASGILARIQRNMDESMRLIVIDEMVSPPTAWQREVMRRLLSQPFGGGKALDPDTED